MMIVCVMVVVVVVVGMVVAIVWLQRRDSFGRLVVPNVVVPTVVLGSAAVAL